MTSKSNAIPITVASITPCSRHFRSYLHTCQPRSVVFGHSASVISRKSITKHRRDILDDEQRRDISLRYIQTIYLAVVHRRGICVCICETLIHRRDISLSYIQTHLRRRCTSARYQSFLYTDAPTSPFYIGEISVFVIYRRRYLAVVHRRGGGSILDNLLNNRYCEVGEFCLVLYIETVT